MGQTMVNESQESMYPRSFLKFYRMGTELKIQKDRMPFQEPGIMHSEK